MTSRNRFVILTLVALFVLSVASPAFGTAAEEEAPETTVAEEPVFAGDPPVVVSPPLEIAEEELPWTARYLYPTIAVLAVLLVGGLAIRYNRSIRKRYVVE